MGLEIQQCCVAQGYNEGYDNQQQGYENQGYDQQQYQQQGYDQQGEHTHMPSLPHHLFLSLYLR
jgi:hypothetical protein